MTEGKRPKVYLAASAADMARAKSWRDQLIAAGVDVIASWIDNVEKVGESNPRDATQHQRFLWTTSDLKEIADSRLVWMLVPPAGRPTKGAWFEAGFAYALARPVVFSGDTKSSIFCSTGYEYESDDEAFAAVCSMVDARMAVA